MCVIIAQPKGTYLSREVAEANWKTNPDGGGFAYIDPETEDIVLYKYMEFEQFWGHFERARSQNRDQDFLVHMRIATHGSVCLANVHPFAVNEKTVMAHNGIIHGMPNNDPEGKDRSDTRMFIDFVLKDMPNNWLDNRYIRNMVENEIGWSKLAFLTSDPELENSLYILNRHKGTTFRGMWFSNKNALGKWTQPKYKASKPQKKVTPINKTKTSQEREIAKARAEVEKEYNEIFGDDYPPDWTPDPTESGISSGERDRRWTMIAEEIAVLIEGRKEWFDYDPNNAAQLAFHPGSMTIYCKRCQSPANTSGMCECMDKKCFLCGKYGTACRDSVPILADPDSGELPLNII